MWLECGIINYKLIIPMMYPIFHQIRVYLHKGETKYLYDRFTYYLGYLFNGFAYLFIKWRMKNVAKSADTDYNDANTIILELNEFLVPDNDPDNKISISPFKKIKTQRTLMRKETNLINIEREKIQKKNSKKQHIFIIVLVIIYLIPMMLDAFNPYPFKTSSSISLFFTIISYTILGRIILRKKIYSHQIFALIIILSSNITIILLIFIGKKVENVAISLLIIFAIVVLFGLYNNLVKKYFNTFMGSPYYFMFIIGAISTCLVLPYEIITVLAFGKDTKFNGIFYQMEKKFEDNKLYPLIFIADILVSFFEIVGIILTIYFFSPYHFIISESISQIISAFISKDLDELSIIKRVFIYILFFVIFLGSLIYNEIFIINICSLNKNTQKYIIKRQKEETDNIKDDVYDDE